MKKLLVPIDRAGRLVLPKGVRRELAIKPGDVFAVSISGLTVTLTPSKAKGGFVRKGRALVFSTGGGPSFGQETVEKIIEEDRGLARARVEAGLRGRKRHL